jgi:GNAT superfamily N-acetyltransferase
MSEPVAAAVEPGSVTVRPFAATDEHAVLSLLGAAFGRWPRGIDGIAAQEFFGWKHRASPFGPSTLLVAELDDELAGFLALMPWRLRFGGDVRQTIRGVDLAVDPAHQRRGVSMALIAATRATYSAEVALGWSNPNERSRGGVLKSGRRQVSRLPRFVGPGAPTWGAIRRLVVHGGIGDFRDQSGGDESAALLADDGLLERALAGPGSRRESIATARDPEFLRWRYGRLAGYRAIAVQGRGGRSGLAIFRLQRHGRFCVAQICELLIEAGDDARLARKLVREVRRASAADLVTCVIASSRTAALCALVRVPGKVTVAANPLRADLRPDPTLAGSWALSLGDLELI